MVSPALGSHSHSRDKDSLDNTGSQVLPPSSPLSPPSHPPNPPSKKEEDPEPSRLKSPGKGPLRQGGSGKGSHRESGALAGLSPIPSTGLAQPITSPVHWLSSNPGALSTDRLQCRVYMKVLGVGAMTGRSLQQFPLGFSVNRDGVRAGVWLREGYSHGLLFVSPSLSPLWF